MKTKRKIYRGWLDIDDPSELPKVIKEFTYIKFCKQKWSDCNPNEKRVKITVEWNSK